MAHGLNNNIIRQMYDLLYKFEREIGGVVQRDDYSIMDLDSFLNSNDIYLGTNNNANRNEACNHKGYLLFRQANDTYRDYWLVKHLRNAFAHGFVEYVKKEDKIRVKDGEKKIEGKISKDLFIPFVKLLKTIKRKK